MNDIRPPWLRSAKNPILTAAQWPYAAHSVFNPGAVILPDCSTLLLCRVESATGQSHLCAARSRNGVDGWVIDQTPTFLPDTSRPEEIWGVEDPRITFVPELGKYAVTYTAFGETGPGVALALTTDFRTFERFGVVMPPDDKDGAPAPPDPRRLGHDPSPDDRDARGHLDLVLTRSAQLG